jgi:tight adherence protein B
MAIYVSIAIFALILGLGAAMAVVIGRQQQRQARNLAVIARGGGMSALDDGTDRAQAKQRADIARKLKEAGQEREQKKKDGATLRELLVQAGYEAPVSRFWIFSALFAGFAWLMLAGLTDWPPVAVILLTVAAFFGAPRWFLKKAADRRQRKFLEAFPDALDASVRLLQAGMPITEAVAMVGREYEGPLREEMMRIYDNQKIGVPLGQAALETAKRIPLTEVHMFATALQIQSETGSSLSEVLSNLSAVIRARFRLKRKIKALSSEAKASAAIIAALPPLVTLGLYAVNPSYISILFETTKGNIALTAAVMWMMIGVLIMRGLINFKI